MAKNEDTDEKKAKKGKTGAKVTAGVSSLRSILAKIVMIVCTVIALLLAVGALLVAMRHNINPHNAVVQKIMSFDDQVCLWFSRKHGVFDFSGKNPQTKNALVNWGIAALLWLGLGTIVSRLIRPGGGA